MLWKKLIGVEEIRTAKHVEDGRDGLDRVRHITRFPLANAGELASVEFRPGLVEETGVPLPSRVLGEDDERRTGETGSPARKCAVSLIDAGTTGTSGAGIDGAATCGAGVFTTGGFTGKARRISGAGIS